MEYPTDQFKIKLVQDLIIELEVQFVPDHLIEVVCRIDLEFLQGGLGGLTVLIIVQMFPLA